MNPLVSILQSALHFYGILIFVYVLMSWFPLSGVFGEIYHVLSTITEPYLGIFRRFIPPIGAMDISPIIAYFVIQMAIRALGRF